MRVKTVPRHMIIHNNSDITSTPENSESISNASMKEVSDRIDNFEVKSSTLELGQANLLRFDSSKDFATAGPSHCYCHGRRDYFEFDDAVHLKKELKKSSAYSSMQSLLKDELSSRQTHKETQSSSQRFADDLSNQWIQGRVNNNDTDDTEVVDLSTKVCRAYSDEQSTCFPVEPEDKFKDTFLYKIMTDPTFLDSIQKSRQQRKFSCPFCKQEFLSDEQLTDHMEVKKDESNQVVCCACKKTFTQKRYLRYHQRCHSERTKFTCDICTRKYTRLDNLARHNAFHVNPDKFSCGSCEKTFARKDLLNKHQKCHDNKQRFYCEECSKYMKGPVTLDNHKKLYHPNA